MILGTGSRAESVGDTILAFAGGAIGLYVLLFETSFVSDVTGAIAGDK